MPNIEIVQVIFMSVCLSTVCVSVCLCLLVCIHSNSKNNGSINLKLEHFVAYGKIKRLIKTLIKIQIKTLIKNKFHINITFQHIGNHSSLKFFFTYPTNLHMRQFNFSACVKPKIWAPYLKSIKHFNLSIYVCQMSWNTEFQLTIMFYT